MPVTAAALSRRFGGRWEIEFDPVHAVWSATRRRGTEVRFLAAHRPSELADKIESAEAIWISAGSGPDWRAPRKDDDDA